MLSSIIYTLWSFFELAVNMLPDSLAPCDFYNHCTPLLPPFPPSLPSSSIILDFPYSNLPTRFTYNSCRIQCGAGPLIILSMSAAARRSLPRQLSMTHSGEKCRNIRLESFSVVPLRSLAYLPSPSKILQGIVELAGHLHYFFPNCLFDVISNHLHHRLSGAPHP